MRITLLLIAVNFVFFVLQGAVPGFTETLWLVPAEAVGFSPWQFVSYMFLHGSLTHILFNMLSLGIFGTVMEASLGQKRFLTLYFASGLGSALVHVLFTGISEMPMLGASGAIFGILAAYGVRYPKGWIFMMGVPIPAALGVFIYAGAQFFLGFYSLEAGIANFGHFGGIITGAALMVYWRWKEGSLKRKHKPKGKEELDEMKFFWENEEWQRGGNQIRLFF
jgi:membrane associated rhomboid family serine protease